MQLTLLVRFITTYSDNAINHTLRYSTKQNPTTPAINTHCLNNSRVLAAAARSNNRTILNSDVNGTIALTAQ